jgi:hypothetical protein
MGWIHSTQNYFTVTRWKESTGKIEKEMGVATGSESRLIMGFCISSVEPSGSATNVS